MHVSSITGNGSETGAAQHTHRLKRKLYQVLLPFSLCRVTISPQIVHVCHEPSDGTRASLLSVELFVSSAFAVQTHCSLVSQLST